MRKPAPVKAFVVRLWTPADEAEAHTVGAPELCGVVERVGSDEPAPFRSNAELLRLLRESVHPGAPPKEGETRR